MASVMDARRRILLNTPHIETASGGVANFKTDMIAQLKECKVNFLPKQSGSGDPSPTNIRPISGWDGMTVTRCGKNLLTDEVIYRSAKDTLFEYTFENGTMNMTVKQSGYSCFVLIKIMDEITPEMVGLCFKYSASSVNTNQQFVVCNPDGTNRLSFGNGQTGIIASEYVGKVLTFRWYAPSSAMGTYTASNMQVEIVPSTTSQPTPYEPYTASTFPISWTQQGTVYGGYVDLVSGEVWRTHYAVDLGTKNWTDDESTGLFRCSGAYFDPPMKYLGDNYCNSYICVKKSYWASVDYGEISTTNTERLPVVRVRDERFIGKTESEVKELLSGVMLAYEQRVPTLITTLTPTQIKALKGINNVYSDADSAEVKYWTH